MPVYYCRLNPPRPTFALDMTEEEARLMQEHAEHWRSWMSRGHVLVFGVVGDPDGPFGVGIVEFPDAAGAHRFASGDPVILANRGFRYDVLPMPYGVTLRSVTGS